MKNFFLTFILVIASSTIVLAEQYIVDCEYSISWKIVFYATSYYSPDVYTKSKTSDFQWVETDPNDHINISKSEVVLKLPSETTEGHDRVLINFKSNNYASVFYYNSSEDYSRTMGCSYTIK